MAKPQRTLRVPYNAPNLRLKSNTKPYWPADTGGVASLGPRLRIFEPSGFCQSSIDLDGDVLELFVPG